MKSEIALRSSPWRFIVSRRVLIAASLSCAWARTATPPRPMVPAISATKTCLATRLIFSSPKVRRDDTERRPSDPSRFREKHSLADGTRHMAGETGPFGDPLIPRLEPRQARSLNWINMPAMAENAECDVGKREARTSHVWPALELPLDHGPELDRALARRL